MIYPNNSLEKKLHRQGYEHVAGIDEVGRGAWAGPLVASAVIFEEKSLYRRNYLTITAWHCPPILDCLLLPTVTTL